MDTMKNNKNRDRFKMLLMLLVVLILVFSSMDKFLAKPDSINVKIFGTLNMMPFIVPAGIIEIIMLMLFLIPKSSSLGYLLLMGYFGGAMMAAFLVQHELILMPALVAILISVANYLRNPGMLESFKK